MKMNRKLIIVAVAVFIFGIQFTAEAQNKKAAYKQFEDAKIYFEQNSTDGDAEVVFKAKAGDEGMTKLMVVDPNGRTVIDFESPGDASMMGIRSFQLESPEPEDVAAVQKAYPAGVYKFSGTTTDGEEYQSEATLSHTSANPVSITNPANDAEDVSTKGLVVTWTPVKGAKLYLMEVEQEDSDVKVESTLLGSASSFSVPENFLLPDTDYKVVVGTVSEDGNLNFVESSFSTAKK